MIPSFVQVHQMSIIAKAQRYRFLQKNTRIFQPIVKKCLRNLQHLSIEKVQLVIANVNIACVLRIRILCTYSCRICPAFAYCNLAGIGGGGHVCQGPAGRPVLPGPPGSLP